MIVATLQQFYTSMSNLYAHGVLLTRNCETDSEYFITLSSEIKHYWPPRNRFTLVTFCFLLNRYLPLLGHVPFILSAMLTTDQDTVSRYLVLIPANSMPVTFICARTV